MKNIFKNYLFNKHILVADHIPETEESFNTIITLKNKLGINITKGKELASSDMIRFAADILGEYIPEPFYRGFPESVKSLTENQLLFDQLLHYCVTYGMGIFDDPGHSVYEEQFERLAFNEDVEQKNFEILNASDAIDYLRNSIENLLKSSRPLSVNDYQVVLEGIKELKVEINEISCKQTVCCLIYDTKDINFSKYLNIPDVIKLVDYINYRIYGNENLKKLNFKNQDRKLITKVLDRLFDDQEKCKHTRDCWEKRKIWCGLLHHIHYCPKNDDARIFVATIRTGKNISVYSAFEYLIKHNVREAAEYLYHAKGSSVVIRNLNYLLSRCRTNEDVEGVLKWVK